MNKAKGRLLIRTQVLARLHQEKGEWVALAYESEGVFCFARASSQTSAMDELKSRVEGIISKQARAWLEHWKQTGNPSTANCPEGAIKLPIDLWACKLVNQTCPIQAQVLLDDPQRFFRSCLAPHERRQQIFDTVVTGKYDGFHHVPGRYLCVGCEHEGKKPNFQHHYPWELTCLEAYYPFVPERDWPRMLGKLRSRGWGLSAVSNALCTAHCRQLAEQLDPPLAAQLRVIEINVSR